MRPAAEAASSLTGDKLIDSALLLQQSAKLHRPMALSAASSSTGGRWPQSRRWGQVELAQRGIRARRILADVNTEALAGRTSARTETKLPFDRLQGCLRQAIRRLTVLGDRTVARCIYTPAPDWACHSRSRSIGKSRRPALEGPARGRRHAGHYARFALPPAHHGRPLPRMPPKFASHTRRQCHQPGRSRGGVHLPSHIHRRHTEARRVSWRRSWLDRRPQAPDLR